MIKIPFWFKCKSCKQNFTFYNLENGLCFECKEGTNKIYNIERFFLVMEIINLLDLIKDEFYENKI